MEEKFQKMQKANENDHVVMKKTIKNINENEFINLKNICGSHKESMSLVTGKKESKIIFKYVKFQVILLETRNLLIII